MAKNIDDLMKHLRNKHNISISGSSQKRELRNILTISIKTIILHPRIRLLKSSYEKRIQIQNYHTTEKG